MIPSKQWWKEVKDNWMEFWNDNTPLQQLLLTIVIFGIFLQLICLFNMIRCVL